MFRERILRIVLGLFVMAFVLWGISQVADADEEQFTFEEICEMFGGEYISGECWVINEEGEYDVVLDPTEVPEETSSDGRYAKFYASNLVAVDNNEKFPQNGHFGSNFQPTPDNGIGVAHTGGSKYGTTYASGFAVKDNVAVDNNEKFPRNGHFGSNFQPTPDNGIGVTYNWIKGFRYAPYIPGISYPYDELHRNWGYSNSIHVRLFLNQKAPGPNGIDVDLEVKNIHPEARKIHDNSDLIYFREGIWGNGPVIQQVHFDPGEDEAKFTVWIDQDIPYDTVQEDVYVIQAWKGTQMKYITLYLQN